MARKKEELKTSGDTLFNILGVSALLIALLFALYPLSWMVLNAFRTNEEMILKPLNIPSNIDFSVFSTAWKRANFDSAFLSSIINSAAVVLLVLVTGSLSAFTLSRNKFPGNKWIVKLLMASIIISGQLILIPMFFVMRDLRIYDTLLSTIFANTAMSLPICIYLLYGFFNEIPYEIEESAMIDGSTRWGFYYKFIVPLSIPIASTIIIFTALWSWNEYLFALTFLKDDAIRTIPLQLQNFFGRFSTEYDKLFAALSISVLPILILYVMLQKAFIKGMTAGAVKM